MATAKPTGGTDAAAIGKLEARRHGLVAVESCSSCIVKLAVAVGDSLERTASGGNMQLGRFPDYPEKEMDKGREVRRIASH